MGKRQHQKDKMYLTYTEWGTLYGGKKPTSGNEFKRLPFDHCCVSLVPYETPYCDLDGNIFELQAIISYIKKFKLNPVTGKPINATSLVKLNFFKSSDGEVQCPVTFKPLTLHSHIIAIKTTGNVFSNEAIERLNIKPKYFKDLITDEPFTKDDMITLQNPANLQKFNLGKFHHIANNLKVVDEETKDDKGIIKTLNKTAKDILKELDNEYKTPTPSTAADAPKADKFNAAHYSTGKVAAGFTSTVMPVVLTHEPAILSEDDVRYDRIKKKGYVRLVTNYGPLNIELFCDFTPKTCENFIKLCDKGYYNNTIFHRSIKHFMLQGGDPKGTGLGGKSFWGKSFKDEFKAHLTHSGRGVVSMANSGPNTNKSQFFITYRSCRHLDNKHTVFGKIVGGMDTLAAIERIEVDNRDRPIETVKLITAQVFVDPYQEVDDELATGRQEELDESKADKKVNPEPTVTNKVFKSGIGKYINPSTFNSLEESDTTVKAAPAKKKNLPDDYSFGSFKNW